MYKYTIDGRRQELSTVTREIGTNIDSPIVVRFTM